MKFKVVGVRFEYAGNVYLTIDINEMVLLKDISVTYDKDIQSVGVNLYENSFLVYDSSALYSYVKSYVLNSEFMMKFFEKGMDHDE